jgi:hypothetical protein
MLCVFLHLHEEPNVDFCEEIIEICAQLSIMCSIEHHVNLYPKEYRPQLVTLGVWLLPDVQESLWSHPKVIYCLKSLRSFGFRLPQTSRTTRGLHVHFSPNFDCWVKIFREETQMFLRTQNKTTNNHMSYGCLYYFMSCFHIYFCAIHLILACWIFFSWEPMVNFSGNQT